LEVIGRNQEVKLFLKLIWLMIILSVFGGIFIGGSETQIFAKYGASKKVLLPAFYLIIGIFIFTRRVSLNSKISRYTWLLLWGFVFTTWLSLLKSLLLPQQTIQLNFLLQGILQISGLVLFIYTGILVANYDEVAVWNWSVLAAVVSVLTAIIDLDLSPFIMLYIPLSFFLLYVSNKLQGYRRLSLITLGLTCLLVPTYRNLGYESPSLAWILELSSIFLLFLSLFLKPTIRRFFYKSLFSLTLIVLPFTSIFKLLIGISPRNVTDVTLLQRSFETSTVIQVIFKDPITWLFGLGPGGYLNMTWSPDYRTLTLAGRNIEMVDDAHFLTSWILLKLGFVGLSAFLCLVVVALKSTMEVMTHMEHVNPIDFLFSANVIGGIAIALTAGTNFFTNPLLGISIGIIMARSKILKSTD
jgi:hypothetical protein